MQQSKYIRVYSPVIWTYLIENNSVDTKGRHMIPYDSLSYKAYGTSVLVEFHLVQELSTQPCTKPLNAFQCMFKVAHKTNRLLLFSVMMDLIKRPLLGVMSEY